MSARVARVRGHPELVPEAPQLAEGRRRRGAGGQREVPDGQRDRYHGRAQPPRGERHGSGIGAGRCAGRHVDLDPDRLVLARAHRERGRREPTAEGLAGLGVLERDERVRPPARRVGRPGARLNDLDVVGPEQGDVAAPDDPGSHEIRGLGVDVGQCGVVRRAHHDLERLVLVPGGLDRGCPGRPRWVGPLHAREGIRDPHRQLARGVQDLQSPGQPVVGLVGLRDGRAGIRRYDDVVRPGRKRGNRDCGRQPDRGSRGQGGDGLSRQPGRLRQAGVRFRGDVHAGLGGSGRRRAAVPHGVAHGDAVSRASQGRAQRQRLAHEVGLVHAELQGQAGAIG